MEIIFIYLAALFAISSASRHPWKDGRNLIFFEEPGCRGDTIVAPQGWWAKECNPLPFVSNKIPRSVDPESVCVVICADLNCQQNCREVYHYTPGRLDLISLGMTREGLSYRGCDYTKTDPTKTEDADLEYEGVDYDEETPPIVTIPPSTDNPVRSRDPPIDTKLSGWWRFWGGANMRKIFGLFYSFSGK